jgi:non-ribosomal peptide synthetase component E (peptide arylation enzyme)
MNEKHWTFEIVTGKMYAPDGNYVGSGYAGGNLGRNPEAINNPFKQDQHNIGPLPAGMYTFGEWLDKHPKLGKDVFSLAPDKDNVMYGRSGFYCHGDTVKPRCASEGCIVMPNAVRKAMYNSDCHRLKVMARTGV